MARPIILVPEHASTLRVTRANPAPDQPLPSRVQRASAAAAIASLFLVGAAATPFAKMSLLPIPGYMTAFGAAMVVINLILAAMLYSKGAIERRGGLIRLATAYLFVAMIFGPLILAFPGGIMEGSVIGTATTAIWLWSFWHAGFGLYIVRYAWQGRGQARRPTVPMEIVAVMVAVAAAVWVSITFLDPLSQVLPDGRTLFGGPSFLIPIAVLGILTTALVMVYWLHGETTEGLWVTVAIAAAIFDVWLTYQGSTRFSVGWYLSKCGSLFTSLAVLISLLHEITRLYRVASDANRHLLSLAQRDGLTGLFNRRHFDEAMELEWRRSGRTSRALSLLMIDVDYFKTFNDTYGHQVGDDCLRRVGSVLEAVIRRSGDVAARYGGEEFVLLMPTTDAMDAAEVAERVQLEVQALAIPHAGSPFGFVTVSIGVANVVATANLTMEAFVAEADRSLYRAKRAGRAQTCWDRESLWPGGVDLVAQVELQSAA